MSATRTSRIEITQEAAQQLSCDALIAPAWSEGGKVRLAEAGAFANSQMPLEEYLLGSGFKAKVGEVAIIPTFGRMAASALAIVGLGSKEEANANSVRRAAGAVSRALSDRSVVASLLHAAVGTDEAARAAAEGFLLGAYQFVTYKSDTKPTRPERFIFVGAPEAAVRRGELYAEATSLARDLTNEPASSLTPELLAERTRAIAEDGDLQWNALDEQQLRDRGFGGILGVAAGSARPPRLIELRYKPAQPQGKAVLVGKGVTFDSGGLSLKDAKQMETMKTDKGGAAAAIATLSVLARLGAQVDVTALVPAVENMPGSNAIKPGDVLVHYGKKTTEVVNTDAEGRLILADALEYACEQDPDAIIDVATLTGSIMVALGRKATGLFCNDESLADALRAAGDKAGERLWPMPLYDDYKSELESEVADMKNVGSRYGGAITAAVFLSRFVKDGIPWAHLDIAGAARAESDYDEITKGGTGAPTRTLIGWIEAQGT